jgi:hypothetical protein
MESKELTTNDVWDQLLDKLLQIGDDLETNERIPNDAAEAQDLAAQSSPSSFSHRGHVRQGSDTLKLVDTDDIWSKGVASRSGFQKQASFVRRPSLETVLESGPDYAEPLVDRQLTLVTLSTGNLLS